MKYSQRDWRPNQGCRLTELLVVLCIKRLIVCEKSVKSCFERSRGEKEKCGEAAAQVGRCEVPVRDVTEEFQNSYLQGCTGALDSASAAFPLL